MEVYLRVDLRGVDSGNLLVIAGLDKFVVDEKAQGLGPLLAIGGSEFGLHIS